MTFRISYKRSDVLAYMYVQDVLWIILKLCWNIMILRI